MSGQWDDKAVTALRVAVRTGDGSIVTVLHGRPVDEVLQQAGDAILEAVAKDMVGAVAWPSSARPPCASGSGPATRSWRTSWRRPPASARRRCCRRSRSTPRSWPACSK